MFLFGFHLGTNLHLAATFSDTVAWPFCTPVTNGGRFSVTSRSNPYYQYVHPHTFSQQQDGIHKNSSNHTNALPTRGRARERQDVRDKRKTYNFEGTFFGSVGTPRRGEFTIHPEWVSEQLPRRSKSAPPPRSRNPITWE